MIAGLPLMKIVLIPLAKSCLLQIKISAGMSAADEAIQNKIDGSGTTALIISNEEMEDTRKIIKSLKKSELLVNGIGEKLKTEQKYKKEDFFQSYLEH